jgi:hypothetical protein
MLGTGERASRGRVFVRRLADGHDVISVDNYFPGGRRNLASILDNPRFQAMTRRLRGADGASLDACVGSWVS